MNLKTCVDPGGFFVYGIHKPSYEVDNLRHHDCYLELGDLDSRAGIAAPIDNHANFPLQKLHIEQADWVYEILNPFPFRGATYISGGFAHKTSQSPESIRIPAMPRCSLLQSITPWMSTIAQNKDQLPEIARSLFSSLPEPVLLSLATCSDDPDDLEQIARLTCEFKWDSKTGKPAGLVYQKDTNGRIRPKIFRHDLYEAVANNPYLPDIYKQIMVLNPGVQGNSEIIGEYESQNETELATDHPSHVWEYLRTNSYIPWGHYAANMAQDLVKYDATQLSPSDMQGMRHLYYQRTYVHMARELGIPVNIERRQLTAQELENLRLSVLDAISQDFKELSFSSTMWGWNYGFDFSPSRYRLNASHQQIHQQYAFIPDKLATFSNPQQKLPTYACGDQIDQFIAQYKQQTGKDFFSTYIKAILSNQRTDGDRDKPQSLIVFQKGSVMLFVPKAQTSQWELQIMTTDPIGNILEADMGCRKAIDQAFYIAIRILAQLGAKMITNIEFSKRFHSKNTDQRLIYSILPRLPFSPGAFSEAQNRWINRHFPEDFAHACRQALQVISK